MIKYKPIDWNPNSETYLKELPERTIDLTPSPKLEKVQDSKLEFPELKPEKITPEQIEIDREESFERDADTMGSVLLGLPEYREAYLDMPDKASELMFVKELVINPNKDPEKIKQDVLYRQTRPDYGDFDGIPEEFEPKQIPTPAWMKDKYLEKAIDVYSTGE